MPRRNWRNKEYIANANWGSVMERGGNQLRVDEYHSLVELVLARDVEYWIKVTQIDPQLDK